MKRVALCLLVILTALPVSGQSQDKSQTDPVKAPAQSNDEVISLKTTLVPVAVTVMDKKGRFIIDLKREDFTLYDEDTRQEIAYFESVNDAATIILLMDVSGSMTNSLNTLKEAANAFISSLRPIHAVLPVAFDSRVQLLLPQSTSDRNLLAQAIRGLQVSPGPESSTSLYDAVQYVTRNVLSSVKGHKALVLMSDGVDTTSKAAGRQDTLQDVTELGAPIYSIYFQKSASSQPYVTRTSPLGASQLPSIRGGFTVMPHSTPLLST